MSLEDLLSGLDLEEVSPDFPVNAGPREPIVSDFRSPEAKERDEWDHATLRVESYFERWRGMLQEILKEEAGSSDKERAEAGKNMKRKFEKAMTLAFFRENVLPTLRALAKTPEEMMKIGEVSIGTIGQATDSFWVSRGKSILRLSLVKSYFANEEAGAVSARGHFKWLYENYGLNAAWVSAGFHAKSLRKTKKCLTTEELKATWDTAIEREGENLDLFTKFINILDAAGLSSKEKKKAMKVLSALEDKDPQWMRSYMQIHEGRYKNSLVDLERNFPLLNEGEAINEMKALDEYDLFRDELIAIGRGAIFEHKTRLTFQKGRTPNEYQEKGEYPGFNITAIPDNLRRAGYGDEDIKRVLELPKKYPVLRHFWADILLVYPQIDRNFPGGGVAFFEFLNDLGVHDEGSGYFFASIIKQFITPQGARRYLPPENREVYVEVVKDTLKYLRGSAGPCLDYPNWSPHLKRQLKEDPEGFKESVRKAREHAFQFFVLGHVSLYKEVPVQHTQRAFGDYLKYVGEPGFEDFVEGSNILARYWAARKDKAKSGSLRGGEKQMMNFAVSIYGKIPDKLREARHHKKSLPPFDYKRAAHALTLLNDLQNPWGRGELLQKEEFEKESEEMTGRFLGGVRWLSPDYDPLLEEATQLAIDVSGIIQQVAHGDRAAAAELESTLERLKKVARGARKRARETEQETAEKTAHPRSNEWGTMFRRLNAEARTALKLNDWHHALGVRQKGTSIIAPDFSVPSDHWLRGSNESTQLSAISASLFLAMGFHELGDDPLYDDLPSLRTIVPAGRVNPMPLGHEKEAFLRGEIKMEEVMEAIRHRNLEDELRQRMSIILPLVADRIQAERLKLPGLMGCGMKVETIQRMSARRIRFVLELGGLGGVQNKPYHVKHGNHSLVHRPLPSAFELQMQALLHNMFGIADGKSPDFQVTSGTRWAQDNARTVGASMLLATRTGVQYKKDAFGIDWVGTGARMMVYDAGVRTDAMPFDLEGANGRTDMLGRRDLTDITWWQILQTGANHLELDGPFAHAMKRYREKLRGFLYAHGRLDRALHETDWVYEPTKTEDTTRQHQEMIAKFTQAWKEQPRLRGLIRLLIGHELIQPMLRAREGILRERPDEVEYLKKY